MIEIHNGPWTLGVLIGLPIVAIVVVIAVVGGAIVAAVIHEVKAFLIGLAIAVVVAAITGVTMWPWHAEYHRYQDVRGTVTNVNHRLVTKTSNGDKSIEDKYVVTLQGTTLAFGITDTRASLLKVGDPVSLRCLRVYEFRSTNNGYDCKWGG